MEVNGILYNYNTDNINKDISMHGGIPKKFNGLKDKKFGDWEIPPWELYIFIDRLLGKGAFSKVYLAKWRETFVVAKIINPEVCNEKKEFVLREIDIMSKLHHPNIVQFLGYIDNPFIIILEYVPKGDLFENNNISKLYRFEKINIMKDILRGLAYLHNRKPHNLIHRDIKPTNILLTKSKTAKITDFGLSKFYQLNKNNSYNNLTNLTNSGDNELSHNVGTSKYMAPELLNNQDYDNKIDIYACGILLYELFENRRYISNIKLSWYWCPKKIKNIIINYMLCKQSERLDALTILNILENKKI